MRYVYVPRGPSAGYMRMRKSHLSRGAEVGGREAATAMSGSTSEGKGTIQTKEMDRQTNCNPTTGNERQRGGFSTSNLLLVATIVTVLLASLAPTVKESLLSVVDSFTYMEAYMGDGILIGDSETNFPFSTVNWTITQVPKNTMVRYHINVEMYFYNHTMLGKYYICTIRGTDACPFQTSGYMNNLPFKQKERHLIIAYVHPTSLPGFFTTRLLVEAKMQVDYITTIAFLCACVVFFIIKHCLQGTFGCCKMLYS
ncbi:hypothetical protein GBAR_LOCUS12283 [Geodia barretti]|uniref:Uncharacterized protein n=1 Tax=Geodia barretti TaxID=519541 RepID=A0AA35WKK7_GEOBA|nr:hypothetical protein GBAR_LOCUS12283 [Geodia barretti]